MLEMYLFGRLCVKQNGQVLEGIDARKVQELLCYLLLHRDHSLSREVLSSILWPNADAVQSKKYLRQTLWQLQSALAAQVESSHNRVLLVQPEWVQLNEKADVWLDIATFEQAYAAVEKKAGRELEAHEEQKIQQGIELHQKPLLEDCYEDWCLRERERLQTMYLVMLDKLMDYNEVHHNYERGIFYGMRILQYEPTRESTHRRLMRLRYLAGDRASALRQFEHCATILDKDFGVKPSRQTVALYNDILTDQIEEYHPGNKSNSTPQETNVSLPGVFNSLSQLQAFLTDLQQQMQQNIQRIEYLLTEAKKISS